MPDDLMRRMLLEYVTISAEDRTRDDLYKGHAWKDADRFYFQLSYLEAYLQARGFHGNKQFPRSKFVACIHEMGGDNKNPTGIDTKRGYVLTYWLPATAENKSTFQP